MTMTNTLAFSETNGSLQKSEPWSTFHVTEGVERVWNYPAKWMYQTYDCEIVDRDTTLLYECPNPDLRNKWASKKKTPKSLLTVIK